MSFFDWFSKLENRVVVWAMITSLAISANLITTTVVVTYVMQSENRHQARVGRLAATITRTADQVNRELKIAADDLDQLIYLNRYPWTRNDMIEFCIKWEKLNPGDRCPDVIAISPDLQLLNKRNLPITPNIGEE